MQPVKISLITSDRTDAICDLIRYLGEKNIPNVILDIVIATAPNPHINEATKACGVHFAYVSPDNQSRSEFNRQLAKLHWERRIDMIVTVGLDYLIHNPLLEVYADRIINIHYSLLPAFAGRDYLPNATLEQTLTRGVTLSGVTAYIVDSGIATGVILGQYPVNLQSSESMSSLKAKLLLTTKELLAVVLDMYPTVLEPLEFGVGYPEPLTRPVISLTQNRTREEYFNDEKKAFNLDGDHYNVLAICDKGLKRSENMDTVFVTPDARVFGVADGIGSALGGKETSRRISYMLTERWNAEKPRLTGHEHGEWLRHTVIRLNNELLKYNNSLKEPLDLGSTLVAGLYDPAGHTLYVSNTGDSRAYLWRDNTLYRLTRDHSEHYNPYVDNPSPLTFYVGGEGEDFGLDLYQLRVRENDIVILCSDGLLYAYEETIAKALSLGMAPDHLAEYLLERTYAQQAPDNIGFVLFSMQSQI